MNNKFFKVNLHSDEENQFNIICYRPLLSSSLRDAILDRPIFERCSEALCVINCGLTYDDKEEISKEAASIIINNILENEEKVRAYEEYLDALEKKSILEYNSNMKLREKRKKKNKVR